jgi:TPR repeat protein/serine/threonine protein kinase
MKSCPTCHSTYPSDFAVCPRDATTLLEVGLWSEGSLVRGKYRVLGKVGVGGMAAVYKALHVRFDELRALKVMAPELASNQQFVKRFMHEAVITRKLQHPNAVRLDDIDEAEDGRPFIVMEYIEGRSLKEVIQQEAPMSVELTCSIARQVAAALDAAHRLGMVHRDIKPANIVLVGRSRDGVGVPPEFAKVLDFGIAKIKEAHLSESRVPMPTLTGTGMVVGTPAYMSPEQAMGKRGDELDGRSDLYSLGIVMYQMLTGELPLKADSEMQMVLSQINTLPPNVRTKRPDVPEGIVHLVMSCLEKMANQRPANAQVLIDEIEYWEEESARLERARAEQEGIARERAEAKRAEREKDEEHRRTQEVQNAVAKTKAEREQRARERAEAERTAYYSDAGRHGSAVEATAVVGHAARVSNPRGQPWPSSAGDLPVVQQATPTGFEAPTPRSETRRKLWVAVSLAAIAIGTGAWYLWAHSVSLRNNPDTKVSAPGENPGVSGRGASPQRPENISPMDPVLKDLAAQARRDLPTYRQQLHEAEQKQDWSAAASLAKRILFVVPDDPQAQYALGTTYEKGQGTQDYGEALKWYRKAAEQNEAKAETSLGNMYVKGWGVAQDYGEALKWVRKAAEQSEPRAETGLGWMYETGRGVTQDRAEAVKWYRKAAEQNEPRAQANLGAMYINGQGVTQDYGEALKLFRQAAAGNNPLGQFYIGFMYESGQGVTRDYEEGLKWFRKAAEQNYPLGQFYVGLMYESGRGVTRDYGEALKWFRKAAEQNYPLGQFYVGLMYESGEGVMQDHAEASKWVRKAAEQGNSKAKDWLSRHNLKTSDH